MAKPQVGGGHIQKIVPACSEGGLGSGGSVNGDFIGGKSRETQSAF